MASLNRLLCPVLLGRLRSVGGWLRRGVVRHCRGLLSKLLEVVERRASGKCSAVRLYVHKVDLNGANIHSSLSVGGILLMGVLTLRRIRRQFLVV